MSAETQESQRNDPVDLRTFIETIPALVVCVLADGSAELANRGWQEYTGCSMEEIAGPGWHRAIHPDDLPSLLNPPGIAAPTPVAVEARLRGADGGYRWFSIRKATAVWRTRDGGAGLRTLVACEDIDDRKRAQQKLQESEALLKTFFDNSPNAVFIKDPHGKYRYVNQKFRKAFRLTDDQILDRCDDELFPAEQAALFQANDRQVIETGAPMEFEEISLQEDGRHTSIVQKFPLFGRGHEIYAIGCIATDITERQRQEAARRYSEEQYRLVVQTANDAVISIDESGTIQFANPATKRIFGYDPVDLAGRPLTLLMPQGTASGHDVGFSRDITTGNQHLNRHGAELIARRKDGQEFPVEVSFGEVTRGDNRTFTGFIRDISGKKQAEEERERLHRAQADLAHISRVSTMGELTASLTHEIRQPISAMQTNARTCIRWLDREEPDLGEAREAAVAIVHDAQRTADIVNRMATLFRKAAPKQEPVDVNHLIQEMMSLLHSEAGRYSITMRACLAEKMPEVFADRVGLQQVLMNLMLNGIDAMKEVATRRELVLRSELDESQRLLISVSDTGAGLRPEHAEHVFDAFFSTKPHGIGMGLPISRSIIESHGGRLWVESNNGTGATFYFTVPIAE